jgi:hypothetical protein
MVVLSMLASMLVMPQLAFAKASYYDTSTDIFTTNDERADYGYKILGTSSSIDLTSADDLSEGFEWKQNNYVWVGVTLSNLDAERAADIINGVTSVGASVLYNNTYLEFESTESARMFKSLCNLNTADSQMSTLSSAYEYSQAA